MKTFPKKDFKFFVENEKELKKVTERLLEFLEKGIVVLFYGDLGVGKTTLIKHIINNLIEKKKEGNVITSPTFNLINRYYIDNLSIIHCDLYRLENKNDKEFFLKEIVHEISESIIFIEWAEKLPKFFLNKIIKIFIHFGNKKKERKIKIKFL